MGFPCSYNDASSPFLAPKFAGTLGWSQHCQSHLCPPAAGSIASAPGGARCVSRAGHTSSVSPVAPGPGGFQRGPGALAGQDGWLPPPRCRWGKTIGCHCSSARDKQNPSKHRASRRSSPPAPGGRCRLLAESWKPQAGVKQASRPIPSTVAVCAGFAVPCCPPALAGSSKRGQGVRWLLTSTPVFPVQAVLCAGGGGSGVRAAGESVPSPPTLSSCIGPWGPVPAAGLSPTDLLGPEALPGSGTGEACGAERGGGASPARSVGTVHTAVAEEAAGSLGLAALRRQLTFWKEIAALRSFL